MNIFKRIAHFFFTRYYTFVIIDRRQSTITLSRSLYRCIMQDEHRKNPGLTPKKLLTTFFKSRHDDGALSYGFMVNPRFDAHGVDTPNMVYQAPILVDPDGHLSVKLFSPTADEILAVYGITDNRVILPVVIGHVHGSMVFKLSRKRHAL